LNLENPKGADAPPTTLTVVGWLWRSDNLLRYSPRHANVWARMIHRHLSIPHRFVLMTDQPEANFDPLIQPVPLWDTWRALRNERWGVTKPQCYVRLRAFSKKAEEIFGPRFVSMDLDCVVLQSLDPVFNRAEDFLIIRRDHHTTPYNGSMWMMTAGARAQVFDDFKGAESIEVARKFIGTDQAWINCRLGPNEKGWDLADGVWGWPRIRNQIAYRRRPPDGARIVFFYGGDKPWNLVDVEQRRLDIDYKLSLTSGHVVKWQRRPLPPPRAEGFRWVEEAYR
jgi:hypothetical protein